MDSLREPNLDAMPTAKPFVGRALVLRLDLAALASTLATDLVFMRKLGVQPIVVHDVEQHSYGSKLVGLINRVGGDAVGIDGTSASTLVLTTNEAGHGVIRSVNPQLLTLLLEQGYIPIFSAQGTSVSGAAWPLDAADAARALAASVHAVRLLFPSGTGGISAGGDGIIDELTSSEALALAAGGTLSNDDASQLAAAALSVRSGVDAAQLLDLRTAHATLVEMLTAQHLGTQIVSNIVLG